MIAAPVEQFGPLDVIRYGELPTPRPGSTEVLVGVEVSGQSRRRLGPVRDQG
ncbi:hypothetical protein [Streptomyces sp. NPDC007991]|uniref:hypothetical protein n=1 Tax=Streptomyces sp. NPDC007991 TaxID=3364803 RepID=UPI0036EFF831